MRLTRLWISSTAAAALFLMLSTLPVLQPLPASAQGVQYSDCRWYGKRPICHGRCPEGKVARKTQKCAITGHRYFCCRMVSSRDGLRLARVFWYAKNNSRWKVHLKFFNQNRSTSWPGGGRAYSLYDGRRKEFGLACRPGDKICWGAWTVGSVGSDGTRRIGNRYWGVGRGTKGCRGCCTTCDRSRFAPSDIVLTTQSARRW